MKKKSEGITFMYDQEPSPSTEINQPAPGVDYRAESPSTYSKTPSGEGDSRPPGNAGDVDRDQMDPSSAKVIPDSMKETLQEQLTYPTSQHINAYHSVAWYEMAPKADPRMVSELEQLCEREGTEATNPKDGLLMYTWDLGYQGAPLPEWMKKLGKQL